MSVVEFAVFLIMFALLIMVYYMTPREPVKYALQCSAYLTIAVYLIKQMF